MQRLSSSSVVEELATQLAESRRARIERQAAYVALARAILADEPLEAPRLSDLESTSHAA